MRNLYAYVAVLNFGIWAGWALDGKFMESALPIFGAALFLVLAQRERVVAAKNGEVRHDDPNYIRSSTGRWSAGVGDSPTQVVNR